VSVRRVHDEREHLDYWESFYSGDGRAMVPREPSGFARWVASRETAPGPIVDVGTGTGRDALWLAGEGYRTVGLDFAESALRLATTIAEQRGLDAAFQRLDVYHADEAAELGRKLATELAPRVVYARFFVHALEDDGRRHLWQLTRELLADGGALYLEFRVERTEHEFGEHYRRFVAPEVVVAEIEEHGGTLEHQEVGTGLAVYKHEDPRVCRLAASWS
jgi:SAM-dependent methyltransferase